MRIKIDEELCTGCGVCESLCPDVFQVGEDEKSRVLLSGGSEDCDCQEAVDSCPAEAIIIEE